MPWLGCGHRKHSDIVSQLSSDWRTLGREPPPSVIRRIVVPRTRSSVREATGPVVTGPDLDPVSPTRSDRLRVATPASRLDARFQASSPPRPGKTRRCRSPASTGGQANDVPSRCRDPARDRGRRLRCLLERKRLERASVRRGDRRSHRRPGPSRRVAVGSAAAVTINWYHIQNNDPGKSLWQKLADDYTAAHPNVKVNITVLENEAFKTKLTTLLQAGTPPDLFQSWGGGGLREQQTAGLVKDISADVVAVGE